MIRAPVPAPQKIFKNGKFRYGLFDRPVSHVNMTEANNLHGLWLPRSIRKLRLKEWRSFNFGDRRWSFTLCMLSAKFFSSINFFAHDHEQNRDFEYKKNWLGSAFRFPEFQQFSRVRKKNSNFFIDAINNLEGGIGLEISFSGTHHSKAFAGRFRFNVATPVSTPHVICEEIPTNAAIYRAKFCSPFVGEFYTSDGSSVFDPTSAVGIIEEGKAFYPWEYERAGLVACGLDEQGRRIGLSLGSLDVAEHDSDEERNTENCAWIDNVCYPLADVKITQPNGMRGEWVINDTEGKVDLIFTPKHFYRSNFNAALLYGDSHNPIGTLTGKLYLAENETIDTEKCQLNAFGEISMMRA